MTKRKTPAKTPQNATKQLSESVEAKINTTVAKKSKASTNASQKASTGRRGRPKKALVEKVGDDIVYTEAGKKLLDETLTTVSGAVEVKFPAPVQKAVDVDSRTITYVAPETRVDPKPPLYRRFKDWLVFKLYHYTSYFKGY